MKADKGQGIFLVNRDHFNHSLENLFNGISKVQLLDHDPAIRKISIVQSYLNTLYNRHEVTLEDENAMTLKLDQVGQAQGLPKIHKNYNHLSPFCSIIDTTNTAHYGIAKYLSNSLHTLTENKFTVKDSFDAASKIEDIPNELFDEGYRFISFYFTALFTDVPVSRAIKITLKCISEDKVIHTTLRKWTMKKLIIVSCTKTAFSSNNKIYKQIQGVLRGSHLGTVLAVIITTEFKKIMVKVLYGNSLLKV